MKKIAEWFRAKFLWCAAPWLGRDGAPARTMVVMTVVLGSYLIKRPIPELLSVVAIIAAHGTKPLMAWIERSASTLSGSSQVTIESKTSEQINHTIIEQRRSVDDDGFVIEAAR